MRRRQPGFINRPRWPGSNRTMPSASMKPLRRHRGDGQGHRSQVRLVFARLAAGRKDRTGPAIEAGDEELGPWSLILSLVPGPGRRSGEGGITSRMEGSTSCERPDDRPVSESCSRLSLALSSPHSDWMTVSMASTAVARARFSVRSGSPPLGTGLEPDFKLVGPPWAGAAAAGGESERSLAESRAGAPETPLGFSRWNFSSASSRPITNRSHGAMTAGTAPATPAPGSSDSASSSPPGPPRP